MVIDFYWVLIPENSTNQQIENSAIHEVIDLILKKPKSVCIKCLNECNEFLNDPISCCIENLNRRQFAYTFHSKLQGYLYPIKQDFFYH